MNFTCFNGIQVPAHEPVLHASNRAFSYGDGIFETIKVLNGQIPLSGLHFKRLFHGMALLKLPKTHLNADILTSCILDLCEVNKCSQAGRVRLQVYRSNEGESHFIIEAAPLQSGMNEWQEKGFVIDIFPSVQKTADHFANLKSCNFLPYVMAGLYARENLLDDALVLNTSGRIADSGRANIFLVKDEILYTPSPEEGCVEGVMRAYLLEKMKGKIIQTAVTIEDIAAADEVFLTNAIFGVRWVSIFKDQLFTNKIAKKIYFDVVSTIFP